MLNKSIFLTIAISLACSVFASEQPPINIDIKREVNLTKAPRPDLIGKRIYLEFTGSPKMTKIMQEKLKSKGFMVVDKPEDSDSKFVFLSGFSLRGAGKQEIRGSVGELIENSVTNPKPGVDYKHQNTDLLQVGVSVAYSGIASVLSITDMIRWMSQKTGVAGRFNEMLTGDPRGFCYGTSCTNYTNSVRMSVTGAGDGGWFIEEVAVSEKIVIDILISDSVETILKPFYDLQPLSETKGGL